MLFFAMEHSCVEFYDARRKQSLTFVKAELDFKRANFAFVPAMQKRDCSMWVWSILLAPLIGSFVGVIVTRVQSSPTIVLGRSACEQCTHLLGIRDLVPLLSWMALRGHCRYCSGRIGSFYPSIELAAVAIAGWSALTFLGWLLWASCLLGWTLLALAVTDLRYYLLPNFLTLPLIAAGLLFEWALDRAGMPAHAIGAVAGYTFVIVLRQAYWRIRRREGMGLGDAKLLAAAGAWVSWTGLPTVVLLAALSGLAFALLKSTRGSNFSSTSLVPFGTFLCFGTWVVWLYGPLMLG